MFVGQRKDPFAVNLGEIFDLVNIPASAVVGAGRTASKNDLDDKNVTSLIARSADRVPHASNEPVIGGWTTASLRQAQSSIPRRASSRQGRTNAAVQGGALTQVSRLGMPLVNEVVIGLQDKDRFNASEPKDDGSSPTT